MGIEHNLTHNAELSNMSYTCFTCIDCKRRFYINKEKLTEKDYTLHSENITSILEEMNKDEKCWKHPYSANYRGHCFYLNKSADNEECWKCGHCNYSFGFLIEDWHSMDFEWTWECLAHKRPKCEQNKISYF